MSSQHPPLHALEGKDVIQCGDWTPVWHLVIDQTCL